MSFTLLEECPCCGSTTPERIALYQDGEEVWQCGDCSYKWRVRRVTAAA